MLKLQETKKGRKKLKNTNFYVSIFVLTDFVMFFDRGSYTESLQKLGINYSKKKPSKNVIRFALFFKFQHTVH